MKQALFLLIIFSAFGCKKQHEKIEATEVIVKHDPPPPPKFFDKKTLIGFACFSSGSKSNSVIKISDILENKNFTKLKAKLFDKNPAEKYLATVACEKLEKKNLIKLSLKESNQIELNKSSKEKVTICSGCTNKEIVTLNDLFYSEDNFLSKSIEEWLNEMIK